MNRHMFLINQIHKTRRHLQAMVAALPFESRDPWLNSTSRFVEALTEQHHDEQLCRVRSAMGAESQGIWAALMTHPMSFDEKRKLSMAIHNLPRTKLGRVIEILERRHQKDRYGAHNGATSSSSSWSIADRQGTPTGCGTLAPVMNPCMALSATPPHFREHAKIHECIEVDLDELDTRTMRELELYVRNVAAQTQKKKLIKLRKRVPIRASNSSASETLSGDSSDHYQDHHYQSSSAD
eukprot:CAMPEP_0174296434 /NCGR_PEP_ID=MMETSP0809-20121228/47911_1 /TAXON_ID=73025 ORGANISM="Eutreptiella gymnastica-like, Strain CCMP1594" /NCGR_SAMPLE_ID=MMETSP0809 /ASSEMBLY_ACC=CAM_ASM_000658 /LENGTH=237 /DNA_ID=CAMNT_0015399445 /DNA_START=217 /DNA_END=930 /DNA_ORIENTATION=+